MKKATLILLAGLALASAKDAISQTVSGYITDFNQPISGAVVHVDGISPDGVTNEQGFYVAGDTTNGVEFPYIITPVKTDKFKIYNINGQLVRNLENITNGVWDLRNNSGVQVATGPYFFYALDNKNNIIGSGKVIGMGGYPVMLEPNVTLYLDNHGQPLQRRSNGRELNDFDNDVQIRINHPDYWEMINYIPEPVGNITYNEVLCSGDSLDLAHTNYVLARSETYGSVAWPDTTDPIFTIWPYFTSGAPMAPYTVDWILQALDSIAYYSEELFQGNITGRYEIVDSLGFEPGRIYIYGDSSIPFWTAWTPDYNVNHEATNGIIRLKHNDVGPSAIFDEIFKSVTMAISDSNILIPSIYNTSTGAGGQLYDVDKKIIEANNLRGPNWKAPDTCSP